MMRLNLSCVVSAVESLTYLLEKKKSDSFSFWYTPFLQTEKPDHPILP